MTCHFRVDADKDSFVTLPELEEWIIQKVQEHFQEAHQENEKIFHTLDMDKNGKSLRIIKSFE